MFVVQLKFAHNKAKAGELMEAHNDWLKRGFDEGVFMLAGSLQPNMGGAIFADNTNIDELWKRIDADPFVAEGVVSPEILEISPAKANDRLQFLLN